MIDFPGIPDDPADLWTAGSSPQSEYCEVYVDGRREPLAVRASVESGYADCLRTDDAGNIERDGLIGSLKYVRRWGRVKILPVNHPSSGVEMFSILDRAFGAHAA